MCIRDRARTERYPPQVKYIVGNELCERFSFYGMRSILTLYMMQYLLFAQQDAKAYFHYFVMANYLTPLLGGWIADRFWGRYRTILWISLGYVGGHAVLAIWETPAGLLAGLSLIALGAGDISQPRTTRSIWLAWMTHDEAFWSNRVQKSVTVANTPMMRKTAFAPAIASGGCWSRATSSQCSPARPVPARRTARPTTRRKPCGFGPEGGACT